MPTHREDGSLTGSGAAIGLFWQAIGAIQLYLITTSVRNHWMRENGFEAIQRGLIAARRWWVWILIILGWTFYVGAHGLAWLFISQASKMPNSTIEGPDLERFSDFTHYLLVLAGITLVFLQIIYCRNIDGSLYRRNFWYRAWQPLMRRLDWCPSFFLYLVPIVCIFIPTWNDIMSSGFRGR